MIVVLTRFSVLTYLFTYFAAFLVSVGWGCFSGRVIYSDVRLCHLNP